MFCLDVKDDVKVNSKASFQAFHLILCDVKCMQAYFTSVDCRHCQISAENLTKC